MLDQGADTRDALAFSEAVASLGGSLIGASPRWVQDEPHDPLPRGSRTFRSSRTHRGAAPRAKDIDRVKRLTLDESPIPRTGARHQRTGSPARPVRRRTLMRGRRRRAGVIRRAHARRSQPASPPSSGPTIRLLLVASSLSPGRSRRLSRSPSETGRPPRPRRRAPGCPPRTRVPARGCASTSWIARTRAQTSVRLLAPAPRFADRPSPLRLLGTGRGSSTSR